MNTHLFGVVVVVSSITQAVSEVLRGDMQMQLINKTKKTDI